MKKILWMLVLLLLLSGCGNETDAEIETELPETGEIDAEAEAPSVDISGYAVDGGDGVVSDGYLYECADPFYGTVCTIRLPRLNIDTAMTQELNTALAEQYFQKYAYCIEDLENGESPYRGFDVTYDWADCGDVIAIVLSDTSFVNGSDAGGTGYETLYYNRTTDDVMELDQFLEWYTDGEYDLESVASAVSGSGMLTDLDGTSHTLTADEIQAILPHPETGTFTCYTSLRIIGAANIFELPLTEAGGN